MLSRWVEQLYTLFIIINFCKSFICRCQHCFTFSRCLDFCFFLSFVFSFYGNGTFSVYALWYKTKWWGQNKREREKICQDIKQTLTTFITAFLQNGCNFHVSMKATTYTQKAIKVPWNKNNVKRMALPCFVTILCASKITSNTHLNMNLFIVCLIIWKFKYLFVRTKCKPAAVDILLGSRCLRLRIFHYISNI